jgi:FkbM family methyltransferase
MNLNILRSIPVFRRIRYKYLKKWVEKNPQGIALSHIKGGLIMKLSVEDWVQQNIFLYGYYEENETEYLLKRSQTLTTFFDIGANVGYYSLLASTQITINKGKIYAFEPVSKTYNRLLENISLNNLTCVKTYPFAISDSNATFKINIGNDQNWGMSSITKHKHSSNQSEIVKCMTLDTFCNENQVKNIDLIKIDVEGAEFKVLKGMEKIITDHKPEILIEILDENLNPNGITSQDVFNYLWEKGYKSYEISRNGELKQITIAGSYRGLICFK